MAARKIWDQHGLNFVTMTICGWVDIFSRKVYKDMIIENLKHCQEHKGLRISGYVIMSNHIHLLVGWPPINRTFFKVANLLRQI